MQIKIVFVKDYSVTALLPLRGWSPTCLTERLLKKQSTNKFIKYGKVPDTCGGYCELMDPQI